MAKDLPNMRVEYPVYEDGVIEVRLMAEDTISAQKHLFHLALRYLCPELYQDNNGKSVQLTNIMGGETEWFILPHSFGIAVGKCLIEQKVSGLAGFNEDGFMRMISWMVEMEELNDSMCY